MGKPYKIKRHKRIYRRSAGSIILRVAVIVAAIGILFALGWALYAPVSDWIQQRQTNLEQNSTTIGSSQEKIPVQTAEPTEQPQDTNNLPPAKTSNSSASAVAYLPIQTVADPAKFSAALNSAKAKGYDSIMFDLKSSDGTVNYPIAYQAASDARATSASPVDLNSIVSQIKEAGLIPVASIYTFRDHIYPSANKSAATLYKNSDFLWVDNAPDKGGKPWINPFSTEGQAYIRKIVDDACAAGFQMIVLQGTQFPTGYSLDMIDYGEHAADNKNAFLKQYLEQMTEYAANKGVELSGMFTAANMLGANNSIYFGDATAIAPKTTVVDFSLNVFGNGITNDSVSIPNPTADPYNTIKTAGAAIRQQLSNHQLLAYIGAEGMTEDVLSAHLKGASDSGIQRYIVRNPTL